MQDIDDYDNLEHHSSICVIDGTEKSLEVVFRKIKQAELPIKWYFENNGSWNGCQFVYAYLKCDGNTANSLTAIIRGLVELYRQ